MSKVTKAEIQQIGQLARLTLSDTEIVDLQRDLSSILDHMDVLATVDTTGVEPMTHVIQGGAQAVQGGIQASQLRSDLVAPSLAPEVVLSASSHTDAGCFSVPSILPRGRTS